MNVEGNDLGWGWEGLSFYSPTTFISHKCYYLLSAERILFHLLSTTPFGRNQGLMGKTELEGIIKVSDKLIHSTNIDSNSGGQKQTVSSLMKLFTSPKQSSKDNPGSEENTLVIVHFFK